MHLWQQQRRAANSRPGLRFSWPILVLRLGQAMKIPEALQSSSLVRPNSRKPRCSIYREGAATLFFHNFPRHHHPWSSPELSTGRRRVMAHFKAWIGVLQKMFALCHHHKSINLRMNYGLYTSTQRNLCMFYDFADGVSPNIFVSSLHQKLELVDRYFVVERSWASSKQHRTGTAKGEARLCVKNASSDTLNDSLWVN